MKIWLVPREELTPDQLRAVELDPKEHRVVFGAPGSGKTIILVHRAHYLSERLQSPPERFRIFVFTNVLKDYIRSGLELLGLPMESVTTFHSWCMEFYRQHISARTPWNAEEKCPDFDAIQRAVFEKLSTRATQSPLYDFVLVDEGQDLTAEAFDILKQVSRHVTVCMDHKQQIYDNGSSEQKILRSLGLKKRNMSLLEAYRCSPYIVKCASSFIEDLNERTAYLRQTKMPQTERETPLLYLANDFEDEKARLIQIIKARQAKGERVAIILPQKRQVYGFAKGLKEAGLEVEVPGQKIGNSDHAVLDFATDLPKLMPIPSAKGLTFDTVLMPRFVRGSFKSISPERLRRLLFVGMTRATRWFYISSIAGSEAGCLDDLQSLAQDGSLTVQRFSSGPDLFRNIPLPAPAALPAENEQVAEGGLGEWF